MLNDHYTQTSHYDELQIETSFFWRGGIKRKRIFILSSANPLLFPATPHWQRLQPISPTHLFLTCDKVHTLSGNHNHCSANKWTVTSFDMLWCMHCICQALNKTSAGKTMSKYSRLMKRCVFSECHKISYNKEVGTFSKQGCESALMVAKHKT